MVATMDEDPSVRSKIASGSSSEAVWNDGGQDVGVLGNSFVSSSRAVWNDGGQDGRGSFGVLEHSFGSSSRAVWNDGSLPRLYNARHATCPDRTPDLQRRLLQISYLRRLLTGLRLV